MTQEFREGTLTVLFTDVEGSTDLTTRLGNEAAREVLRACDELVRQQVARHRGQAVRGTGGVHRQPRRGGGDPHLGDR